MTVDGDFYPCERVSEKSVLGKIGNIFSGIYLEKAEKILNIGKIYEDKCRDCWAYSACDICIAKLDDTECNEKDILPKDCKKIKFTFENNLKDYCVLKSLGYKY
ncbi:MAG: SPASM domain-containing protein [Clostridioides sp.]|jgi:uncharacterized protein|nr:SPASM domain-containing protein [Clostridioides sp.]